MAFIRCEENAVVDPGRVLGEPVTRGWFTSWSSGGAIGELYLPTKIRLLRSVVRRDEQHHLPADFGLLDAFRVDQAASHQPNVSDERPWNR
jgi:hypothetical protein